MRRVQSSAELLFGLRIDPSSENAEARKRQRVRFLSINDSEFKIAVKRRSEYGLPIYHGYSYEGRLARALI